MRQTATATTPAPDRYDAARDFSPKQSRLYYRLGAHLQNVRTVRGHGSTDPDTCCQVARTALTATSWSSMKAAEGYLSAQRLWVGF